MTSSSHHTRRKIQWDLVAGAGISLAFVLIALLAPRLAPVQPVDPAAASAGQVTYGSPAFRQVGSTRNNNIPHPPSPQAILGTNGDQLDIYYALIWGTRDALRFGLVVAVSAALLGTLVGILSGYFGGWTNWSLMRLTDGFLTFPLIAGVIVARTLEQFAWQKLTGGLDYYTLLVGKDLPKLPPVIQFLVSLQFVIILFTWMPYARLVNALVLRLKESEFVEASRALGAGSWRVILRHLLPNSVSPAIVLLSRDIGGVVLIQAALTFIGFSGASSGSVWGFMLAMGRDTVLTSRGHPFNYWWVFVPIGLALVLFGIGWSLMGDGLNDLLNPRRERI